MVLPVGPLIEGNYKYVYEDINAVVQSVGNVPVKVIFETGFLNKEQIVDASLLSVLAGAKFVKTSTGFGPGGAKVEDIKLMKTVVGSEAQVKASGGVKSLNEALAMIQNGATRIGTSSGISIANNKTDKKETY